MPKTDTDNQQNIYSQNYTARGSYPWNPSGRRLAAACRFLSFLFMPVLWIVLVICVVRADFMTGIVSFGGILWIFLALLVLIYGILVFVNNLFVRLSRKLSPEGRHDFVLYRCQHVFRNSARRRAELLLVMAKLDLQMKRFAMAEDALREVNTEKISAEQIKFYDLLWMCAELLKEKENPQDENDEKSENVSVREWYTRYSGITAGSGRFPDDETVRSWVESDQARKEVVSAEIADAVSGIREEANAPVVLPLLNGVMLAHCIFFLAVLNCLGSGWHLRPNFSFAAGILAGIFVLILGIGLLYLILRARKRLNGPAKGAGKARMVIGSIAWMVLIFSIAVILFLVSFPLHSERIVASGVEDAHSGKRYDYIALGSGYGGTDSYYRAPNFMFMEEWSEAVMYDQDLQKSSSEQEPGGADTDESAETSGTAKSTASGEADNGDGGDHGFTAQNAMQKVYEYLKDSGTYPDADIEFSANAKGDLYALILTGSENHNGTEETYELRLYDNGDKDSDGESRREIVLEKVWTAGDSDTELIDFYLVNPATGEVTDEHKTSW